MSEDNLSYQEQLDLLLRAVRQPGLFRFIIVQYNHPSIIGKVEEALRRQFAERPLLRLQVEGESYYSLLGKITHHQGFILLEDFHQLLADASLYIGFNQRRDKISELPIQILCFLPIDEKYILECMDKLRDWWSIRNLVVRLETKRPDMEMSLVFSQKGASSFGGYDMEGKKEELERLLHRIGELEEEEEAGDLLPALYKQALSILADLEDFVQGAIIAEQWARKAVGKKQIIRAFEWLGWFHFRLEKYQAAKENYIQAIELAKATEPNYRIEYLSLYLGGIYMLLNDPTNAFESFKNAYDILKHSLGNNYPLTLETLRNMERAKEEMERNIEQNNEQ